MIQAQLYHTPESRWSAVVSRDSAATGRFVYAVRTTGIYCRPDCKARLARRANVSFFDTVSLAETAGYRPCKRCKPEVPIESIHDPIKEKIQNAVKIVQTAASKGEKISLMDLSEQVGLSKWHLQRVFKRTQGVTPREMMNNALEADYRSIRQSSIQSGLSTGESSIATNETNSSITTPLFSKEPSPLLVDGLEYEDWMDFSSATVDDVIKDLFPELYGR